MSHDSPVRGLRRIELRATNPAALADYYQQLLGWLILTAKDDTLTCWVGERQAAHIRTPQPHEQPGWHLIFSGPNPRTLTDTTHTTAHIHHGRAQHGPWAPPPRPGEPCWTELTTPTDTTHDYWATELGWTNTTPGLFHACGPDGHTHRPIASHTHHPHTSTWTCYFAVHDVHKAATLATELGGTIHTPPHTHPTGLTTTITDPAGNTCALLQTPPAWGGTTHTTTP
ncbi:VOC family protein [Goodfellowiella coeruleoviolacea]|uniref:Glyoxalase/fosfomycin resistance/dioxygenase domain-containing protein n=1 Tax=Goodfellowiella coeruleoviolacea TaxID=334858 RepID=A0AAE3GG19_9PSEU|nr:VOC family protein [Goodfellowiella coeruleoviolacea]MCP2167551.1 hypothetical protein [Goodfellowiella coeruleoviolacea]